MNVRPTWLVALAATTFAACSHDAQTSSGGSPEGTGASHAGGSTAAGNGQGAGGGGSVVDPPATCEDGSTALPASAPRLEPGVWTDISPSGDGISFGGEGNLTQGMTIAPCNPALLYVAICAAGGNPAYPKGVYRSADAGGSWERILQSDSPNHIRVDPANPKNVYVTDGVAGGTQGFWRTRDGGVTWTHRTNMCDVAGITSSCGMNDLYDVAVDPTNFDHLLVSFHAPWNWGDASQGAGVLESFDGGDTWKAHGWPNAWGYGHSIHFLSRPDLGIGDAATWLLGIQNGGGRWRTTDGGVNWTKVSDVSIVHGGSSLYYTKEGTLYSASEGGMIKSHDNGATWTLIASAPSSVGVIGDGKSLYAAQLFGPTPMMTALEAKDDAWAPHGGDEAQLFQQGPFEMAFDAANRIVYTASNGAGVWALELP
jgi:hypothetical protein